MRRAHTHPAIATTIVRIDSRKNKISANLLGGIESLCDHIADLAETAMDGARLELAVAMTEGSLH